MMGLSLEEFTQELKQTGNGLPAHGSMLAFNDSISVGEGPKSHNSAVQLAGGELLGSLYVSNSCVPQSSSNVVRPYLPSL